MKLWLVLLLVYPDGLNVDQRVGPYASRAECEAAVQVLPVKQEMSGGPAVAVYCDDGCGQVRVPTLIKIRDKNDELSLDRIVCRAGVCGQESSL